MAAEIEPEHERALALFRMLPLDKPVPVQACSHTWYLMRVTERHARLGVDAKDGTWRSQHSIILAVENGRFELWVPWSSDFLVSVPRHSITRLVEVVLQHQETKYNTTYGDLLLRINRGDLPASVNAARASVKRELLAAAYGENKHRSVEDARLPHPGRSHAGEFLCPLKHLQAGALRSLWTRFLTPDVCVRTNRFCFVSMDAMSTCPVRTTSTVLLLVLGILESRRKTVTGSWCRC